MASKMPSEKNYNSTRKEKEEVLVTVPEMNLGMFLTTTVLGKVHWLLGSCMSQLFNLFVLQTIPWPHHGPKNKVQQIQYDILVSASMTSPL
jgi:hypothetical protein